MRKILECILKMLFLIIHSYILECIIKSRTFDIILKLIHNSGMTLTLLLVNYIIGYIWLKIEKWVIWVAHILVVKMIASHVNLLSYQLFILPRVKKVRLFATIHVVSQWVSKASKGSCSEEREKQTCSFTRMRSLWRVSFFNMESYIFLQ